MARKSPLMIGLDVGTYKIGVIVAEVAEGSVEVVGIGTAASRGLRKGVVVNIEKTVEAIRRAVEEAELMAACEIRSVIAGSAGSHIKGFNSHGVVAVRNRGLVNWRAVKIFTGEFKTVLMEPLRGAYTRFFIRHDPKNLLLLFGKEFAAEVS